MVEETKIYKEIHISKHLSKLGDWCGCCGKRVPIGTQMIVFKCSEGNRHITQQHLTQFVDCEETDRMFFKKPPEKFSLEGAP